MIPNKLFINAKYTIISCPCGITKKFQKHIEPSVKSNLTKLEQKYTSVKNKEELKWKTKHIGLEFSSHMQLKTKLNHNQITHLYHWCTKWLQNRYFSWCNSRLIFKYLFRLYTWMHYNVDGGLSAGRIDRRRW